jgi:hypothetical protein
MIKAFRMFILFSQNFPKSCKAYVLVCFLKNVEESFVSGGKVFIPLRNKGILALSNVYLLF